MSLVSLHVSSNLVTPVKPVGFWYTVSAGALVPMPEAPIYEDHLAPRWKHQVGFPRQITPVEAKTITQ